MSKSSPIQIIAILLALLALTFSLWQFASALIKVKGMSDEISQLQARTDAPAPVTTGKWLDIASSHGAGGAAMQARLRASARNTGVLLARVEIQPKDLNQPAMIKASAQVSGSVQALAKFIYQLESQTPALIIERARFNREDQNDISLDLIVIGRMSTGANP